MNRPGELNSAIQRLRHATRELQFQWRATRETWDDQTARDFEENHLKPMMPKLRLVMSATSELTELYQRAAKECADERDPDAGLFY